MATPMKTYVLLEQLAPTAPIYLHVSKGKRMRIDKIPKLDLHLQYTFEDVDGKNKTVRLKMNSNSVYLEEQVKAGVPANERFTTTERRATRFLHGVLKTNSKIVQDFLAVIPDNENFKGNSQTIRSPKFREYNEAQVISSANKSFLTNLAAANKIAGLSLAAAQEMLYKIHGTHYRVPTELDAAQNALVDYMDSSEAAVDEILKTGFTIDEEVTITVGKLVTAGLLSFEAIPGQVAKQKNGQWIAVKAVATDITHEERKRIFMEFLTTPNGLSLLADLKNDVDKISDNLPQRLDEEVVSSVPKEEKTEPPAEKLKTKVVVKTE